MMDREFGTGGKGRKGGNDVGVRCSDQQKRRARNGKRKGKLLLLLLLLLLSSLTYNRHCYTVQIGTPPPKNKRRYSRRAASQPASQPQPYF